MTLQEFLSQLETITSRANNEKDYLRLCMIDDVNWLLDDWNHQTKGE